MYLIDLNIIVKVGGGVNKFLKVGGGLKKVEKPCSRRWKSNDNIGWQC